ncbi:hypothetical protein KFE25_006421 [Diacronema lutheri]|uniref:protein-tyrosine-phosphatase n=1 Tax=Diacronema lutheri TaxID=2081491 RepID=A0A8J5XVV0_DIALT|nr:hypothetical protein KFE25_006421 [Diacronema lutheri]
MHVRARAAAALYACAALGRASPAPLDVPVEVVPGLLISSALPASNATLLAALGVVAVVNAAVADGVATLRPSGLAHLDVPLLDADCAHALCVLTPDALARVSDFVERYSRPAVAGAGRPAVLVHCRKGISRSAALVLGHLIYAHGLTLADALRVLRARHPAAAPNSGLMRALIAIETSFRGAPTLDAADHPPPILL